MEFGNRGPQNRENEEELLNTTVEKGLFITNPT